MNIYTVRIYDIKDVKKPKFIDDINIEAESKEEALDMAHKVAYDKFPKIKRMLEIKKAHN